MSDSWNEDNFYQRSLNTDDVLPEIHTTGLRNPMYQMNHEAVMDEFCVKRKKPKRVEQLSDGPAQEHPPLAVMSAAGCDSDNASDNEASDNDGRFTSQYLQLATKATNLRDIDLDDSDVDDTEDEVSSASTWTIPDIARFKAEVSKKENSIVKIKRGETATIRVPTTEGCRLLCWEFASDNYDLGFGVFFEWQKSPTKNVTVQIDVEDEDFDEFLDDDDDVMAPPDSDVERGELGFRPITQNASYYPTSIIVPMSRRDCHLEVEAGSHECPGEGIYLLKFDNSYSLLRGKTLYYNIYYVQ